MLQSYAFQQLLIAEGHSVETINLRNDRQKYMYNHPLRIGRTSPSYRTIVGRLRDIKWLWGECKRWDIFERFLKERLILTKEFHTWQEIKQNLSSLNYDAIVVGADQVWNTFCYDFDWSYFLPGRIEETKKIAFSPSFGNEIPRTQEDRTLVSRIQKYLEDFDAISVREDDASRFLEGLLGKKIPVTADPTILIDPALYQSFVKEPIIKEPYLYYYTPSHAPDYKAEEMAIELSNQLGMKIVTSYPYFMRKTPMMSVVSGPEEFLNLLSNAQIVLGKSYHLVIFSVLFHKSFITLRRKGDSRINSLLGQLKITGRNMEVLDDYKDLTDIDYRIVDEELSKLREKNIKYLRSIVKD